MAYVHSAAELQSLFDEDPDVDEITLGRFEFAIPALLGAFRKVKTIKIQGMTITGIDERAFAVGEGPVHVEFLDSNFESEELLDRAIVHGIGNWRVTDYGFQTERDKRWATAHSLGDDKLGDGTYRRAVFAIARGGSIDGRDEHLALLDHPKKSIRDKAAAMLENVRANPIGDLKAGAKVLVLGTPLLHEKAEISEKLAALGFTVVKALDKADAVLLLPKPGPKGADAIASKKPIVLEGHLRAPIAAAAKLDAPVTNADLAQLEKLLFSGDAKNEVLGFALAKTQPLEGVLLGHVIAVAFFSQDAQARKDGRALLLASAPEPVRQRLQGDTRNYAAISDATKLKKIVKAYADVVEPRSLAASILRAFAARSLSAYLIEPALEAALSFFEGVEAPLFAILADGKELWFEIKRKVFPKGIGQLAKLKSLRMRGPLKSDANIAELAAHAEPLYVDWWGAPQNLAFLRSIAHRIWRLEACGVEDLSELRRFVKLTHLKIANAKATDLSPIEGRALEVLDICDVPAASLAPLVGMPLKSLRAQGPIVDVVPIATLTSLELLALQSAKVTSLDFLAPLHNLRTLEINELAEHDLTPIGGLPLERLEITRWASIDLAPLAKCTTLRALSLRGTKVDDAQIEALKAALPHVTINR